ncbi:MAG: hypothetical protein M0015_18085 [Betaproteobacteria bacterium]|nr:hypothetical protein [Betaproteobacteria bacterium]
MHEIDSLQTIKDNRIWTLRNAMRAAAPVPGAAPAGSTAQGQLPQSVPSCFALGRR